MVHNRLTVFCALSTLFAAAACSTEASAPVDSNEQAAIGDVATMVQRPDGNFDVVCRNGTHEIDTPSQVLANLPCNGGSTPPPSGGNVTIYGDSNSCSSGAAVVTVGPTTNCDVLNEDVARSVSIAGRCIDINPDMTVRGACRTYQNGDPNGGGGGGGTGGSRRYIAYDPSDSCASGQAIATFDDSTDCNTLATSRVSSVSVNGACTDLAPDGTLRQVCMAYQNDRPGRFTVFDPSDSCGPGAAVAAFDATTDCNTLPTTRASSYRLNGQCVDITPDSTIRQLCQTNQPGRVLFFDPSDACATGNLVGSIDRTTDCNTMSTARVSSVMVNGRCIDLVPDGTFKGACISYHP